MSRPVDNLSPEMRTTLDNTFERRVVVDYDGPSIRTGYGVTMEDCISLCAADANCGGFQHEAAANNMCSLRRSAEVYMRKGPLDPDFARSISTVMTTGRTEVSTEATGNGIIREKGTAKSSVLSGTVSDSAGGGSTGARASRIQSSEDIVKQQSQLTAKQQTQLETDVAASS
jgi:hypothetical protein